MHVIYVLPLTLFPLPPPPPGHPHHHHHHPQSQMPQVLLDLSGKRMGASGAAIVAAMLPTCSTATSLDVSRNKLGADGAKHIAGAIRGNVSAHQA